MNVHTEPSAIGALVFRSSGVGANRRPGVSVGQAVLCVMFAHLHV